MQRVMILLLMFIPIACGATFEEGFSAELPDNAPTSSSTYLPTVVSGCSDQASDDCAAIIEYAQFVATRQHEDQIAGVATAIVSGDDIIFMDGFGMRDIAAGLPVTNETFFHIGSVTKSFTALLAAALIEDGEFTWDTPVVQLYPDFALSDPDATQSVTLRHLVSMRSGIPDFVEDDFDVDDGTAEDVFPFLADSELLALPGEEFSYSNLSASAAGYLAVIAATGDDQNLYDGYAGLLTERVLRPIGMETATVNVSELYGDPNYGKSYVLEGGQLVEAEPMDFDGDPLAPSGVIKASISEMALYVQMQLGRGVAANGERLFSAETVTELWQPYLEDYGLGWEIVEIDGSTLIQHEGAFDNYLSIVSFIPDQDIGFVILTNTEDSAENLINRAPAMFVELFGQ